LTAATTNNAIVKPGSLITGTNGLSLTTTFTGTKSGLFTGSITAEKKKRKLFGAILQRRDEGYGWFSGTNETGSVMLEK
jgi:hypothetical protein